MKAKAFSPMKTSANYRNTPTLFNFIVLFFGLLITHHARSQNIVTYAGGAGKESFNDVIQISNGHILIIGVADDLTWIPQNVSITQWPNPG
ncbi:MAG: hypothetical protein IPJ20_13725 [Flammeovirgaceae bacterium]|nr:hypothetical protein [Flammeovirgaceae bacterium]